jgi:hypothetical protein
VIYDPIRRKEVATTPEEIVRQALLRQMLGPLAFPKSLIAVEKKLATLRRADIIVFMKKGDQLVPLVLVECKANRMDEETFWQASGYNTTVEAPFLCLAHSGGVRTYWKEGDQVRSIGFLPPYDQLVQRIR